MTKIQRDSNEAAAVASDPVHRMNSGGAAGKLKMKASWHSKECLVDFMHVLRRRNLYLCKGAKRF